MVALLCFQCFLFYWQSVSQVILAGAADLSADVRMEKCVTARLETAHPAVEKTNGVLAVCSVITTYCIPLKP